MNRKNKPGYACVLAFLLVAASNPVNASSCTNLIPVATQASPAITTSGDFNTSYPGRHAFDGVRSSMWISEVWETPAWIGYEFDSPEVIQRYSINYSNGSITTRAPMNFELQGSNGSNWVTLDTRTNETDWNQSPKRSYSVATPGAFAKYRLFVTDDNDDRNGIVVISIGELTLEACACEFGNEQVPDIVGDSSSIDSSGMLSSLYPAWKAFDSNASSMWISGLWQTPAFIGYEWSAPRFIDQYSIKYSNGSITTRAPKDWQLQGWNGSTWITVDTRNNMTNWGGSETRSFTVTSPGFYTKLRLFIEDDNDDRNGIVVISIGDLSLRGCEL